MNPLLIAAALAVVAFSVTLPNSNAVLAQDASRTSATLAPDAGQPLPNYDVIKFCSDPEHAILSENICVSLQYMNREASSDRWLKTSAAIRAECITTANRFGDYGMLARCIRSHANDAKVQ